MELVDMENMDRTLDAEVMQLAGHFQVQQVILRQKEEKEVSKVISLACRHTPTGGLTTVRYCSICPSTLPSLNWSLY